MIELGVQLGRLCSIEDKPIPDKVAYGGWPLWLSDGVTDFAPQAFLMVQGHMRSAYYKRRIRHKPLNFRHGMICTFAGTTLGCRFTPIKEKLMFGWVYSQMSRQVSRAVRAELRNSARRIRI